MSAFHDHPAWDFVTRLYGRPGIAPACLSLQDRHGIDVTLMLFCLWRGSLEDAISDAQMATLAAAAQAWREATVLPIRTARRWLKQRPGEDSLYRTVLAAEIDCEHGELLMLAALADTPQRPSSAGAMSENLAAFFRAGGIQPDEQDRQAVAMILAAAAGPPQRPVT